MDRNVEFINEIFHYFIDDSSNDDIQCSVIRKHQPNATVIGDYSFPLPIENWSHYIPPTHRLSYENIFTYRQSRFDQKFQSIDDHIDDLLRTSQKWTLTIERAVIEANRCIIFLQRHKTFHLILNDVLNNPQYGCYEGNQSYVVIRNTVSDDRESLTEYRCRIAQNAIRNLTENSAGPVQVTLYVTHKSTDRNAPATAKKIFIGNVTDLDGKLLNVEAEEYIRKRSIDMQLMAQHKYGLRFSNETTFIDFINKLGKAAVTIDLLEVKPSCSVKLAMSGGSIGRSKGAAFILYNSARIENLLKKYDQKVATKYYPETPQFEFVDLALLKEETEWILLFKYISAYPSLISQIVGDSQKFNFQLHSLCTFLNGLVSTFSIYYSRIRILTENRPQLLPVLHARIYLLKCIRIVFNKSLAILNIEPVEQM